MVSRNKKWLRFGQVLSFGVICLLAIAVAWLTYPRYVPRASMPPVGQAGQLLRAVENEHHTWVAKTYLVEEAGDEYGVLVRAESIPSGVERNVFLADLPKGSPLPRVAWADETHINVLGEAIDVRTEAVWLPDGPAVGFIGSLSVASLSVWIAVLALLFIAVSAVGLAIAGLPRLYERVEARRLVEDLLHRLSQQDPSATRELETGTAGVMLPDSREFERVRAMLAGGASWNVMSPLRVPKTYRSSLMVPVDFGSAANGQSGVVNFYVMSLDA